MRLDRGAYRGRCWHNELLTSRSGLFVALLLIIGLVGDGLPMFASPLNVQFALLPFSFLFFCLTFRFLRAGFTVPASGCVRRPDKSSIALWLVFCCETSFVCFFLIETSHYAALGYQLHVLPVFLVFGLAVLGTGLVTAFASELRSAVTLAVLLGSYVGGHVLAIFSFPLNYLRSDMLPVIFWADRALLAGQNPYQHFHVADRIYDFPYLPGMLLVFAPAQALHVDLRWAAIVYIVAGMWLVFWATSQEYRLQVASLIGLFVLNPYLQYRHELYTQGHFFSLIVILVLMHRRRFAWSAIAFGVSCAISQFSWVIFPFFLLNALRRGGWREVGRMGLLAFGAAALVMVPFLSSGAGNIAYNAVGQWDNLVRPIARPINLAFWASYVVRPSHLKWIQLFLLSGIFLFCWVTGRCADLADMLRWMIAALMVFILFNVLLDGYFYLMLLVPMLIYTCVANGWWAAPEVQVPPTALPSAST